MNKLNYVADLATEALYRKNWVVKTCELEVD